MVRYITGILISARYRWFGIKYNETMHFSFYCVTNPFIRKFERENTNSLPKRCVHLTQETKLTKVSNWNVALVHKCITCWIISWNAKFLKHGIFKCSLYRFIWSIMLYMSYCIQQNCEIYDLNSSDWQCYMWCYSNWLTCGYKVMACAWCRIRGSFWEQDIQASPSSSS